MDNNNMMFVIQQEYVLGFMFSPDFKKVVLIEKTKPAFQAGKINGVGGKIEPGETPEQAMIREFSEEAGLLTTWTQFATLGGLGFKIYVSFCTSEYYNTVQTMTEEEIKIVDVADLGKYPVMGNLHWLVPMAISIAQGKGDCSNFEIKDASTRIRWVNDNSLKPEDYIYNTKTVING